MDPKYFVFLLCLPVSIASYRRQADTSPTTMSESLLQLLFGTRTPVHDPLILPEFYWPNYGYEPYWADGEWIIKGPKGPTTEIPLVCGEECGFIERRVKEVCGQKSDTNRFWGCSGKECNGAKFRDLTTWNYKTFNTYCEFLAHQCKDDKYRWALLYRGECIKPQNIYFKPILSTDIVSRMKMYITNWENTFDKMFLKKKKKIFG